MPNQKEYRIVINGISESISKVDVLINKIDSLSTKIEQLNKHGISIQTTGGGSSVQQAGQLEQIQKEITVEITRQNEELRQQSAFVDSTKQAESDVLQIANSILGTYGENIAKLDQINQAIAANKAAQAEVAKQLKEEAIDAATAAESRQRLLDEELRLKQARSEVQGILKNEVKMTQSQESSYDRMSQQLGRLRDALRASGNALSPEQFNKVSEAVDKLDKELKEADKSVGNFQRNVGNYASAADGFQKITLTIGGATREFDNARTAIMELKNAMAQLVMSGQQGTEAYRTLENQMQNLQLAMVTVNDSIDRAKDASAGLHTAVEAMQGLAAIGGIGQGISSLFGIDDGALGEQIKKLTSLMAIMQGLQQLSTQMATGTGIGNALKKVLDVSGLNNNFAQLKDNLKEIGVRLGVVKSEAATASASMGNFSLAMKTAGNAAMALGKSLAAALAATGIIWAISAAIDVLKGLYDAFVNAISITKRMERANKELEASIKGVNEALRYQLEEVNRNVMIGVIDEIDKYSEKLNYIKESEKELIDIYGNLAEAATKDIFGNEHVKVALVNIDEYSKDVKELQKLMATGFDPGDTWSNMFSGEKMQQVYKANGTLARGVGDIIAQYNQLDKTNLEVMQNWVIRIKEGEQYQWVLNSAIKSGDEYLVQAATSVKNFVDGFYDGAVAARDLKTEISGMAAQMAAELAAFQKYGLKNMAAGGARDSKNKAADYLGETGVWTKEQVAEYKKMTEAQFKQQTEHNRKTTSSARKTTNELLQLEKMLHEDKLAVMRDGLTKALAIIEEERRERIASINKLNVSEAKKNEARNAANARYDKEALEAHKKFNEEYEKAEQEHLRNIERLNNDSKKIANDTSVQRRNNYLEGYREEYTQQYIDEILKPMTEKLKHLNNEYERIDLAMRKVRDDFFEVTKAVKNSEDGLLPKGFDVKYAEYLAIMEELQRELKEVEEESLRLSKLAPYDQENWEYLDKDVVGRFELESQYMLKMYSLREDMYSKERDMALANNEIERQDAINTLGYELEEQQKALGKRWENLIEDEAFLKSHNMTKLDAQKKYEDELFDLDDAYRSKQAELQDQYEQKEKEIIRKNKNDEKGLYDELFSYIVNSYGKVISSLEKIRGRIEKNNTNSWGIINAPQMKKDLEEIKEQFGRTEADISLSMEGLREDFAAGWISPETFNTQYQALAEYREQVRDTIKEIDGDIANIPGKFWKGIDEWIQQIASSFQGVLSAIFEYQNGEFDRMQEAIDKELEIVQNKYDEMEEMAQKHKDAMNEIEDELSTARGDRRQHLIDALSSEIQAQREALAEQKKYEKQKEALEKKSDALELDRKKAQRKQDIIQAILNGALAVSQAATNKWPIPAIPLMALAAVATAAQVAIMSATHYREGGLLHGADHEHGGIKLLGGQAEAEGGEFIINKKTTSKNLPLIDFVNSSKRKLSLDDFIDFYSGEKKGKRLFGVNGKYASGGLLPSVDLAERLVNVVVERDKAPIYVSVVDINRAQSRVATVEQLAGKY